MGACVQSMNPPMGAWAARVGRGPPLDPCVPRALAMHCVGAGVAADRPVAAATTGGGCVAG